MQCQKLKTYMETGRVVFLPERAIHPNPAQPRRIFRHEALTELSDSIRQHGVLQPLSVRRMDVGYQLIAGERRLRAAQLAGLTEVPVVIKELSDADASALALSSGVSFLKTVAPFYCFIGLKLVCDGVLRGTSSMKLFMVATFSDLVLRVVLAFIFAPIWGYQGIWYSWPIGWTTATVMSLIFCFVIFKKQRKTQKI